MIDVNASLPSNVTARIVDQLIFPFPSGETGLKESHNTPTNVGAVNTPSDNIPRTSELPQ